MTKTNPPMSHQPPYNISGLYAVTPQLPSTSLLCSKVEFALQGGANLVQYRCKNTDKTYLLRQATALLSLCRQYQVPLIINDYLDLCVEIDADGVHLGQTDCNITAARRLLGADKIIGVSCYNQASLALKAQAEGASYVAFGACFSSDTKPEAVKADLSLFQTQLDIPKVAIGGISTANAGQVVAAGADAIAVINALFAVDDISKTAQQFSSLF